MKIGIQTCSFGSLASDVSGLEKSLTFLKASGGEVAEICYGSNISAADYAAVAKRTGIEIVSSHTSFERVAGDIENLANEHQIFGANIVGIGSMPRKYRFPKTEGNILKFVEIYNKAAEYLQKLGMKLTFHNHTADADKVWFGKKRILDIFLDNTLPNVQMCLDVCWAYTGGIDVVQYLAKYGDRISILHLKDYSNAQKTCVPLGTGDIDFKPIVAAAAKAGTKYLLLEEESHAGDRMENIKTSMKYMEKLT